MVILIIFKIFSTATALFQFLLSNALIGSLLVRVTNDLCTTTRLVEPKDIRDALGNCAGGLFTFRFVGNS